MAMPLKMYTLTFPSVEKFNYYTFFFYCWGNWSFSFAKILQEVEICFTSSVKYKRHILQHLGDNYIRMTKFIMRLHAENVEQQNALVRVSGTRLNGIACILLFQQGYWVLTISILGSRYASNSVYWLIFWD